MFFQNLRMPHPDATRPSVVQAVTPIDVKPNSGYHIKQPAKNAALPCPCPSPSLPNLTSRSSTSTAPLVPRIHRICLARHAHHPPLDQLLILLGQSRGRLLGHVALDLERDQVVLHALQQVVLAAELRRLVADFARKGVALRSQRANGRLLRPRDVQQAVAVVGRGAEAGLEMRFLRESEGEVGAGAGVVGRGVFWRWFGGG